MGHASVVPVLPVQTCLKNLHSSEAQTGIKIPSGQIAFGRLNYWRRTTKISQDKSITPDLNLPVPFQGISNPDAQVFCGLSTILSSCETRLHGTLLGSFALQR